MVIVLCIIAIIILIEEAKVGILVVLALKLFRQYDNLGYFYRSTASRLYYPSDIRCCLDLSTSYFIKSNNICGAIDTHILRLNMLYEPSHYIDTHGRTRLSHSDDRINAIVHLIELYKTQNNVERINYWTEKLHDIDVDNKRYGMFLEITYAGIND